MPSSFGFHRMSSSCARGATASGGVTFMRAASYMGVQEQNNSPELFSLFVPRAAACWTTANCRTGLEHPEIGRGPSPGCQEKQGSAGIKCSEHGHLVARGIYLKPFGAIRRAVRAEEILH